MIDSFSGSIFIVPAPLSQFLIDSV